jgi:hypothetical protein
MNLSGNLTFTPDATYDIGALGLTRPRHIYPSGDVLVGSKYFYLGDDRVFSSGLIKGIYNNFHFRDGTDSAYVDVYVGGLFGVAANFTSSILGEYVRAGTSFQFSPGGVLGTALLQSGDGILALLNSAGTDFDRIQLGGAGSGYPSIKRSGSGVLIADGFGTSLTFLQTGSLIAGTAGGAQGNLIFNGTTSGSVTIKVLAATGTYDLTLPPNAGTSTYQLTTDGAGVLTWEPASSSSSTTLTGDVTGTGTGTVATTIANDAVTTIKILNDAVTTAKILDNNVTFAKIQVASTNNRLLGSGAAGSSSPYTEITLGAGFTMTGTTLNYSAPAGGGGDMLKSVYDPQNLGYISGLNNSSTGGVVMMDGGSAAFTEGGDIRMYGGSVTGANSGDIYLYGSQGNGGSLYLTGSASGSGDGGGITSIGSGNFNGGSLDMSAGAIGGIGATAAGGNITTKNGGGAISTEGTGSIQFGVAGTRSTLRGNGTGTGFIDLPDPVNGTITLLSTGATSTGGLGTADSGKIPVFGANGTLSVSGNHGAVEGLRVENNTTTSYSILTGTALYLYHTTGSAHVIAMGGAPSGFDIHELPSGDGVLAHVADIPTETAPTSHMSGNIYIHPPATTATQATFSAPTIVPFDTTIPQNTEGVEALTITVTPKHASSTLIIEFKASGAIATTSVVSVALYQDSTADALAVTFEHSPNTAYTVPFHHRSIHAAGSTTARTYKIRLGSNVANTIYFLRNSTVANVYNSTVQATLTVTEILP